MSLNEPTDADRRLDAREIDGEPFGAIVAELEEMTIDESLYLVNSFEPVPLYEVLDSRGFEHETNNPAPDEWHVEITHA